MQGCVVLTHSYGELNCDRLHTYYNYFHLYHYSLLTSIHKPVLARAPSSVTNIRYADDTIMLAESEQQLQHMIDKLDATCEQVEKTPEKQCEVNVKGQRLIQVKQYKYLGTTVENTGQCKTEVANRINKGRLLSGRRLPF